METIQMEFLTNSSALFDFARRLVSGLDDDRAIRFSDRDRKHIFVIVMENREIQFLTNLQRYSTSRGALYPGFTTIEYFIGLPFSSLTGRGSLVAGFTSSTFNFRKAPSCLVLLVV